MDNRSPSFTAYVVARGFAVAVKRKKFSSKIPPERLAINKFIIKQAEKNRYLAKYRLFPSLLVRLVVDKFGFKGLTDHYLHRKLDIQKKVEEAIASGAENLVVIAAGMDSLGIYIANRYPQINCIEVDHEITQSIKVNLKQRGLYSKFPQLIPCDFEKESFLEKIKPLINNGEKTVFVIEGVVMYLNQSAVEQLIKDVSSLCVEGSVTILTSIVVNEFNDDYKTSSSGFIKQVEKRNEQFKYVPKMHEIRKIVSDNGLKVRDVNYFYDLQKRYISSQAIDILKKQMGDSIIIAIKDVS